MSRRKAATDKAIACSLSTPSFERALMSGKKAAMISACGTFEYKAELTGESFRDSELSLYMEVIMRPDAKVIDSIPSHANGIWLLVSGEGKYMRTLILLAGLVALFTIGGRNVYACSCYVPSASEIESMTDAEFSRQFLAANGAAFFGRVVKKARAMTSSSRSWEVTFEVERYWKGGGAKRVAVHTATTGAACGVDYKVGERHLVIASRHQGDLQSSLCAHLGATQNKATLLKRLGRGEKPKG